MQGKEEKCNRLSAKDKHTVLVVCVSILVVVTTLFAVAFGIFSARIHKAEGDQPTNWTLEE